MTINEILSAELSLPLKRVESTVALIDEGNTVPFIARYRKEVTGSMNDEVLRTLFDRLNYLRGLEKRREEVRSAIEAQGKLTPAIVEALEKAVILTEIEDIYRPYKQKRKTRASVAREKGLEDLASALLLQESSPEMAIEEYAASFVDEEKGVLSIEEAIGGACDILAEDISDDASYRKEIRALTVDFGLINVKKTGEEADSTYAMYHDFAEKLSTLPGHRLLAINRGEKEGKLKVAIDAPSDAILNYLFSEIVENNGSKASKYVARAVVDSYDRLIAPSVEREIRSDLFDRASEGAIRLFAENLRNLLLTPPLAGKTVLGLDPGYRTGCKLAVVDKTGKVLDTAVIYPTKPFERIDEAKKIVKTLIRSHRVTAIAIGNGTASKESEIFVAGLLKEIPEEVGYAMVSEAGASVYSASETAREEFPDFDVTQRSAVSIARRLIDPLAELVKIDPKSIGVGQYQHDMKPARLDESLTGVVEDCVNSVGVDLNTASHSLLSYVAGLNATTAKNIVKYRDENGVFRSRKELLKVPRLGEKAFTQCAGFLRVSGADEVLDCTGVHPESYGAAKALLKKYGCKESDVREGKLSGLGARVEKDIESLCVELNIGEPTLRDMVSELEKPGRDPRSDLPPAELRSDVMDIRDLKEGMVFTGKVRNVIDFGAFVDIGVHQDGLVHVSEISDTFIRHPSEALSVGDTVKVRIKGVDVAKNRISLSMKGI
ncbi:MAG: RNA-binding transcriptional accessory protein [Ruminococcaceae bacterium]|nr:RNA-binding transcriptional accessory protein [Oscillospiraceae bacterium]